jgi:hypothetical protein
VATIMAMAMTTVKAKGMAVCSSDMSDNLLGRRLNKHKSIIATEGYSVHGLVGGEATTILDNDIE